jgi:hypothetical protein
MDADTSALLDRYSITFGLSGVVQIDSVQPDPNDLHFVTLFISPHTPLSSLGNLYTVAVNNLCDENGVPIDPGHSSITLAYTADNLKDVFTYPNPYRAGDLIDGEPCLVFANLTSEATIYIYNISGDLVKKLHSAQTFGGIKWYLDNQKGEKVGNGIYIYFVEGGEDKFVGKTAIMR